MIDPDALQNLEDTLQRCEGYTELHMWQHAWKELESIPPEFKFTRPVLLSAMQLLMDARSWENAAWLGLSLIERWPGDARARDLTSSCLSNLGLGTLPRTRVS